MVSPIIRLRAYSAARRINFRFETGLAMRIQYGLAFFVCWIATWLWPVWLVLGAGTAGMAAPMWVAMAVFCVAREIGLLAGVWKVGYDHFVVGAAVLVPLFEASAGFGTPRSLMLTPFFFAMLHGITMAWRDTCVRYAAADES